MWMKKEGFSNVIRLQGYNDNKFETNGIKLVYQSFEVRFFIMDQKINFKDLSPRLFWCSVVHLS